MYGKSERTEVHVFMQPLRFAEKITRPAVERDGKFIRPNEILLAWGEWVSKISEAVFMCILESEQFTIFSQFSRYFITASVKTHIDESQLSKLKTHSKK